MQITKLLPLLLLTYSAYAQQWNTVSPLEYCPEFKIQYHKVINEDFYVVRYKLWPQARDFTEYKQAVDQIDNLSKLTDNLQLISEAYCPSTYKISYLDEEVTCSKDYGLQSFSDEYAGLIDILIQQIDEKQNSCEQVIPLIKLQNQISNLKTTELLQFKSSKSIFKIFTDTETDGMIDHFSTCGGKKGSAKFVENLILIEAKKGCLFPEKEGILSFETSQEIAKEIAKDYKETSLIGLGKSADKITKNTILKFMDRILKDQLSDIFPDQVNAKSFIESLDSYKRLESEKPKLALEHMSYITAVEAPLEIVDKILPIAADKYFTELLPKDMPIAQKKSIIDNQILPQVRAKYDQCIGNVKNRINYPSSEKTKEIIKERKIIESNFCRLNPDSCSALGCSKRENLLTDRADIGDTDIVKACVIDALKPSMDILIDQTIKSQKELLSTYLDIDDQKINQLSILAKQELHHCISKDLESTTKLSGKEALFKVDINDYKEIVTNCSTQLERSMTEDFGTLILANIEGFNKYYPSDEKVIIRGISTNAAAAKTSNELTSTVFNDCNTIQDYKKLNNPKLAPSSSLCMPLIEIAAAKLIMNKSLDELLIPMGKKEISEKIQSQLSSCSKFVQDDIRSALLNKDHNNPIYEGSQANNYLKENHEFYKCVKDTLLMTTDIIAEKEINSNLEELSGQLKGKVYITSLKEDIKRGITSCFKDELNKIPSWPLFMDSIENDFVNKTKDKCTEVAISFTLPLVIQNETGLQLVDLQNQKLLNPGQNDKITNSIGLSLSKKYDFEIDENMPSNQYLEKAYKEFKQESPQLEIEVFVESFAQIAQEESVKAIRSNIIESIVESSKPDYNFDAFQKVVTEKCLNDFLTYNKENIKKMTEKMPKPVQGEDVNLKELFSQLIKNTLIRAKKANRYEATVSKMQSICSNPEAYKDITVLVETGIADEFIVSEVSQKIQQAFNEINTQRCLDNLVATKIKITTGDEDILCGENKQKRLSLFNEYASKSNSDIEKAQLKVIQDSLLKTQDIISENLNDTEYIDSILLEDRQIIDNVYKNFDKVIQQDEKVLESLKELAVQKIFNNPGKEKFKFDFIESQIVAAVSLEGITVGLKTVEDSTKTLPFYQRPFKAKIKEKAKESFLETWNYSNIKNYLALDKTSSKAREEILTSVYDYAILPALNEDLPAQEKLENKLLLEAKVTKYIENEKNHANKNYKMQFTGAAHAPVMVYQTSYISFVEKLKQDVQDNTADKVIKSTKKDIKEKFSKSVKKMWGLY